MSNSLKESANVTELVDCLKKYAARWGSLALTKGVCVLDDECYYIEILDTPFELNASKMYLKINGVIVCELAYILVPLVDIIRNSRGTPKTSNTSTESMIRDFLKKESASFKDDDKAKNSNSSDFTDHASKWIALRDYMKREIEAWENGCHNSHIAGGNIGALKRALEHMDQLDESESEFRVGMGILKKCPSHVRKNLDQNCQTKNQ